MGAGNGQGRDRQAWAVAAAMVARTVVATAATLPAAVWVMPVMMALEVAAIAAARAIDGRG